MIKYFQSHILQNKKKNKKINNHIFITFYCNIAKSILSYIKQISINQINKSSYGIHPESFNNLSLCKLCEMSVVK